MPNPDVTEPEKTCQTCRWGTVCWLGLERYTRPDGTTVCDPGDWFTPESELRDVWEAVGSGNTTEVGS